MLDEKVPFILTQGLPSSKIHPSITLVIHPHTKSLELRGRYKYDSVLRTLHAYAAICRIFGVSELTFRILRRKRELTTVEYKWELHSWRSLQLNIPFASGIFQFEIDDRGLITKHVIENVQRSRREAVQPIAVA